MEKLLKRKDYDRIEETVNDIMEDLGLKLFPLNCFEMAFLLGIEIHRCSEFNERDREFIMSKCECGFTVRKGGKYFIYYNDALDRSRIRFAIWHEIARIQLGHLETDCTISCAQMEEEENHFAAYVMAPLAYIPKGVVA